MLNVPLGNPLLCLYAIYSAFHRMLLLSLACSTSCFHHFPVTDCDMPKENESQGSYTFSGQKFQDFPGPYLQISRTVFNDNYFYLKTKKNVSVNICIFVVFSLPCRFFTYSLCFLPFIWLTKADFPITFRSMLFLQAKQNALFEFLLSFWSHDL